MLECNTGEVFMDCQLYTKTEHMMNYKQLSYITRTVVVACVANYGWYSNYIILLENNCVNTVFFKVKLS